MKQFLRFMICVTVGFSLVLFPMVCLGGNVSVGSMTAPKTGDQMKVPRVSPGIDITPIPYPNTGSVSNQNSGGNSDINASGSDNTGNTTNKCTKSQNPKKNKKIAFNGRPPGTQAQAF